jgi:hypothetical protein
LQYHSPNVGILFNGGNVRDKHPHFPAIQVAYGLTLRWEDHVSILDSVIVIFVRSFRAVLILAEPPAIPAVHALDMPFPAFKRFNTDRKAAVRAVSPFRPLILRNSDDMPALQRGAHLLLALVTLRSRGSGGSGCGSGSGRLPVLSRLFRHGEHHVSEPLSVHFNHVGVTE